MDREGRSSGELSLPTLPGKQHPLPPSMSRPLKVESIERISVHSRWLGFGDPRSIAEDLEVANLRGQFVVSGRCRRRGPPERGADGGDPGRGEAMTGQGSYPDAATRRV